LDKDQGIGCARIRVGFGLWCAGPGCHGGARRGRTRARLASGARKGVTPTGGSRLSVAGREGRARRAELGRSEGLGRRSREKKREAGPWKTGLGCCAGPVSHFLFLFLFLSLFLTKPNLNKFK